MERAMIRILFLAILFLGAAVHARAQDVTCGMTVTESITLTQDLTCIGTAFYIAPAGPDPITIDLGEHTVTSDCSGTPGSRATFYWPFWPSGSPAVVTIQNGRVALITMSGQWGSAVLVLLNVIVLQDLVVDAGLAAVPLDAVLEVRNGTFVNGAGVYCYDSGFTVENSHFVDGPVDGTAISGYLCNSRILSNTFSGYGSAIEIGPGQNPGWTDVVEGNVAVGGGISIGPPPIKASVNGNHVTSAPGHGIEPPRDCRRLHSLGGWGDGRQQEVLTGSPRARRANGFRA
jgi:hypothetical protein